MREIYMRAIPPHPPKCKSKYLHVMGQEMRAHIYTRFDSREGGKT